MPKKRDHGLGALYFDSNRKMWRAVIDVGYHPDGRRRQKAIMGKKKATVLAKLDALQREVREHGAPLDRRTTFAAWADHWLTTVGRESLKPNTFTAYQSTTRNWLVPILGKKLLSTIKPSDVRLVIKSVHDAGRGTGTSRKAHAVLSAMLTSARADGLIARNVVEDVDPPSVEKSEKRRALTTNEALAVLRTAAETTEGSRWWVSILNGIRQGERLAMPIDSISFDSGELRIEWSLDEVPSEHGCGAAGADGTWPCGKKRGASCHSARLRIPKGLEYRQLEGRLCILRPKSGKSRTAPLITPVAAALRRHVEASADLPNPHGLVWRRPDGSPYTAAEDEQAWRDLLLAAGVITAEQALPPRERPAGTPPPPTSHCARHTTATVLMELGVDAKIIGEIVGHADVDTTRHYQHVSSDAARNAAELVGAHFAGALGTA